MRGWALVVFAGCGRLGFEVDSSATDASASFGAVLHLPFDAPITSDLTTLDAARDHRVVCTTPTCPVLGTGIHGNAYVFGPSTTVLEAPYTPDLDPSNGFTIALWVNTRSRPTEEYDCFAGKPVGPSANNNYALCALQNGAVLYHSGTTIVTDNLEGSTVPLNTWTHLAMTWDGVSKRGYIDGVLDGVRDVGVDTDVHPITIGADENGGVPFYGVDGLLDDLFVFDRALSQSEIAMIAGQ